MKTLRLFTASLVLLLTMSFITEAQTTTTKKPVKMTFPHVTLSPYGGAIFPLPKTLNQSFKPGATMGLDIGFRINKEVGLYGKLGYYFMSSKITGAPIGAYLEASAGPRYYFTHPKLKSSVYFEGGVGAYNFRQNSYVNPGDTSGYVIEQISNTKAGLNGGIGATLGIADHLDLLVKSKYHVIFTPNGSTSFITVVGGLEIRFR